MRITLCSNNSDYTREEIQCEKEIGNLQSFVFMDLLNKDNIPFTTLLTIQEGYLKVHKIETTLISSRYYIGSGSKAKVFQPFTSAQLMTLNDTFLIV